MDEREEKNKSEQRRKVLRKAEKNGGKRKEDQKEKDKINTQSRCLYSKNYNVERRSQMKSYLPYKKKNVKRLRWRLRDMA